MRFSRFLGFFLVLGFVFFGVFVFGYPHRFLIFLGVFPEEIRVAGTGSMYPTFPRGVEDTEEKRAKETVALVNMHRFPSGLEIFGRRFFSRSVVYGDIVEFENEQTRTISLQKYGHASGFVKRIIGVSGDTVELRDGFVFINSSALNEPYTAKPRSTYGGDFLSDCTKRVIPDGKVFVLGDNRKASYDSRFDVGFVDLTDIHYVLPWEKQTEYRKTWRDASSDGTLAHSTTLDGEAFVHLLNDERATHDLSSLSFDRRLVYSSGKRGEELLTAGNSSSDESTTTDRLSRAISSSGYRNVLFSEILTRGFFDAEELVENVVEFPQTRDILLSSKYQDIGLAAVVGDVDSCPTQIVVAHLGGYVPPTYSEKQKESWRLLVQSLEDVLPSWRDAGQSDGVDTEGLRILLDLLEKRLDHAKRIVSRMEKQEWLTDEERQMVEDDARIAEEADDLIQKLLHKT